MGNSSDPAIAISTAQTLPAPDPNLGTVLTTQTWINESVALAQSSTYIAPVDCGPGPFALDTTYVSQARDTASKQVALSGLRLANVLNEALQ